MLSRILIIDDDIEVCEYVQEVLLEFVSEINFLLHPNLLWETLKKKSTDLILMDIHMPQVDGLTLLKQLKAHSEYHTIPVIMLTGTKDEEIFTQCFEQGAFDYIHKPFNDAVLTARVRSALEIRTAFQKRKETVQQFIDMLNVSMEKKIEELSRQFVHLAKIHTNELTEKQIEQIQILKKVPLFQQLNPFDLRQIAQHLTLQSIDIGQELLTEGQTVQAIYIIKEGMVDVLVKEDRVAQREPGDSIGEMSCFSENQLASATVRAVVPCQVWSMSRDSFLSIIDHIPELRTQMFDILTARLRKITQRFGEILKHVPHGIIQIDLAGIITEEFSSRCAEYLGISQLKGQSLGTLLFAEQESLRKKWEETLVSLHNRNAVPLVEKINQLPAEVIYKHPDGDNRIFTLFYYTVLDEQNHLVGLDIGVDDITQNRHSQHELSSFRSILTNLEQLFILFDVESGRIVQETITNSQLGQAHFPYWQHLKGKSLAETILYEQDAVKLSHLQRWLHMLQDPFCLQSMPYEELMQLAPVFSFETAVGQITELSFTINKNNAETYSEVLGYFDFIEEEQSVIQDVSGSMMVLMEEVAASEEEYHYSLVEALNEMRTSIEAIQEKSANLHLLAKNQQEIARLLHSLKGLAQSFRLKEIAEATHVVETILQEFLKQGQTSSTCQQMETALQSLLAMIIVSSSLCQSKPAQDLGCTRSHPPEIRITYSHFQQLKQTLEHVIETSYDSDAFEKNRKLLEVLWKEADLMELTKLSKIYPRLQNIVQDTGQVLHKKAQFLVKAESECHMHINVANALHNVLIHLVKNAMHHGIEPSKERHLLQKPKQGLIELLVVDQGEKIYLTLRDDGAGLNPKKILNRAIELKLLSPPRADKLLNMNDWNSIYQLIFIPGFSTSHSISTISGRGIGMDVIKTEIEKLGGTINFESEAGKGTSITFTLPVQENRVITKPVMMY